MYILILDHLLIYKKKKKNCYAYLISLSSSYMADEKSKDWQNNWNANPVLPDFIVIFTMTQNTSLNIPWEQWMS